MATATTILNADQINALSATEKLALLAAMVHRHRKIVDQEAATLRGLMGFIRKHAAVAGNNGNDCLAHEAKCRALDELDAIAAR